YTTKGELLTAINNLKEEERKNDRPVFPIVREYTIPKEYVDKLKDWDPDFDWDKECPKIIFKYYPFDLFSETNETNPNLSGIGVSYGTERKEGNLKVTEEKEGKQKDTIIKYSVCTHIRIDTNKKQINMHWFCSFDYKDEETIKNGSDSELKTKYETLRNDLEFSIPFDELKLSDNEQNILVYTPKPGLVAYNGVLAQQLDLNQQLYLYYSTIVILFGNVYMPAVNVSRDRITNVPFKAAVETDIIFNQFKPLLVYDEKRLYSLDYFYKTEEEIKSELKDKWADFINVDSLGLGKLKISEIDNNVTKPTRIKDLDERALCTNIALTFLKQNYSLTVSRDRSITIAKKDTTIQETDTSEFPVQLFFNFEEDTKFGAIYWRNINYYNVEHWFSKWLIENREKLQTEVNPVYKRILQIMIESKEPKMVIKDLNDILDKLKGYKNNMFNIQDERLTQEDVY
ncbi:MAG: hypothetical protein IIZ46_06865, partial [Clostridia bacterium]|nr:hypothetical protein [Clostridia bacterium]